MIAYVLYTPLAIANGILLYFAGRGAVRGYGNGRLIPLTLLLAAALAGSLYFLFAVDADWGRWVAVGLVAAVAVPLLAPVALLVVGVFITWLSGKPIRWN
ncbi:hypothetical protein [Urbifossiella limnaea]|uniref:Uncharacterized protein n=1 Tax=Urbifossiella limnaea TaxID=2528023 RepID=A0A517XU25_9BACT|nr:hypothetical protein [Urbifossiella limnaea]QDU21013.1 hypothetical protein ETAA1_29760 [Urbifossiella limnaea]